MCLKLKDYLWVPNKKRNSSFSSFDSKESDCINEDENVDKDEN